MAELTLEAALKIVESIDARGKARDEKGQFIAQKQLDAARDIIAKDLKNQKGTIGAFKKLIKIQNDTKVRLEAKLDIQTKTLKAEQKKGNDAQKKIDELQKKSEEERDSDHDEQIANQEKIIAKSEKATKVAEEQARDTKEQINPLLKDNRLLKERKDELNKMGKALEEQGLDKNEDKAFRKEQQAIALEEIELRKQGDMPLSKRLELEKEKAKAQKESDSYIQKGFGSLKLGIMGLGEKFGAGAMTIGKGLLTLFGLGLLIKFLESDTWERIRDFIAGPSLETFKEIFMPGGAFDGIAASILTVIGVATAGLALLTFNALGGGLLVAAFKGLFKLLGKAIRGVARFLKIPGFKEGQRFGKDVVDGDGKTKGKTKGSRGLFEETKRIQAEKLSKASKTPKKPGRFGRLFGAAKELGGKALEKGAQAARAVGQSAKAVGSKAVSLGKTGLEKGTQLAKQTVQVGTNIGKDAVSASKAAIPKIAGAGKAGLKAAAAAGKFIPGAGLIIGASVAAVEGVMSGVEEFKESGDAGRAVAEGFGGALSSLTFGAVDKEKFADFFKKEEALSSDQLAQAMAGGPSVGPTQFASLAGGSDAARLRELENELKGGGMTDRMRQNRLSQMKSLEAKMARGNGSGGNNVNVVNQDNSVRSNATNNTHTSTPIVDRDLDFLATASP